MLPQNKEIREKSHQYLSELLAEETTGEKVENKLIELVGNEDDYLALERFFDRAFDETDAEAVAVLQYFCARYRILCTQTPAYVDFMPKFYESAEDLKKF